MIVIVFHDLTPDQLAGRACVMDGRPLDEATKLPVTVYYGQTDAPGVSAAIITNDDQALPIIDDADRAEVGESDVEWDDATEMQLYACTEAREWWDA